MASEDHSTIAVWAVNGHRFLSLRLRRAIGSLLRAWPALIAGFLLGSGALWMLWPMLARWDTYGFHDWDLTTAHRYITQVSLRTFRELPFWNPWLCGGYPAFGYIESATNLVSPYLPFYLLFDVRTALRIEVIGSTAVAIAGSYWLARRFTRSAALAAFPAALFGLNGRWALQLATGHTWHLEFCWLPWAWFAFDRAQDKGRSGSAILAGVFVSLTALAGGIYPLPYMALFLIGYALLLAMQRHSLRPFAMLAVTGGVGAGLAAPKLLPMLDTMAIAPRLTDSKEVIGFAELVVMLTARRQSFGRFPVPVPEYEWHEWGIYIGCVPLVLLGIGALFARGPRENALRLLGIGALIVGFGAFHPNAPWPLLHALPIFSSLHVPSRIHPVMVLCLASAFAAWAARHVDGLVQRIAWFDGLLLLPVALLVVDLSSQAQRIVRQGFWVTAPEAIHAAPVFEHHRHSSQHYRNDDGKASVLLPMFANQGVLDCQGVPDTRYTFGALATEDREYRGMAEVVDGRGSAVVTDWSPNRAVVRVDHADEGATVVYNMNYDPGWLADRAPAVRRAGRVAARLHPGQTTMVFQYRPRWLDFGNLTGLVTLGAIAVWHFRGKRQ